MICVGTIVLQFITALNVHTSCLSQISTLLNSTLGYIRSYSCSCCGSIGYIGMVKDQAIKCSMKGRQHKHKMKHCNNETQKNYWQHSANKVEFKAHFCSNLKFKAARVSNCVKIQIRKTLIYTHIEKINRWLDLNVLSSSSNSINVEQKL